jgi:hypothetical protein
MRSADTDTDVDKAPGLMGMQLRTPKVRPEMRELWQQKFTASNAHFDCMFIASGFGHECSVQGL